MEVLKISSSPVRANMELVAETSGMALANLCMRRAPSEEVKGAAVSAVAAAEAKVMVAEAKVMVAEAGDRQAARQARGGGMGER